VAATASPLPLAMQNLLRRHREWRCKKRLFFEIVSPMVYFLKSFEVWVNFV
jgi:hypothetical protein